MKVRAAIAAAERRAQIFGKVVNGAAVRFRTCSGRCDFIRRPAPAPPYRCREGCQGDIAMIWRPELVSYGGVNS